MADLSSQENLQPSLLDRLRDDEPDKLQESRDKRVLTLEQLEACVVRDLGWLLNSENLTSVHDLSEYPDVENSTVNYGVPSLSGYVFAEMDEVDIERQVRESILRFEPRLLKSSLKVEVELNPMEMDQNHLRFTITANMWAKPLPIHLIVNAEVDLENGDFRVTSG